MTFYVTFEILVVFEKFQLKCAYNLRFQKSPGSNSTKIDEISDIQDSYEVGGRSLTKKLVFFPSYWVENQLTQQSTCSFVAD